MSRFQKVKTTPIPSPKFTTKLVFQLQTPWLVSASNRKAGEVVPLETKNALSPCVHHHWPPRGTRWGYYLPLTLKEPVRIHVCVYTHMRAHTDEDWLCLDNTIFNLLLKVRLRYHCCQQHSFVSQQRNSSHIRLGFGRRQALRLSDFNKPIHVEGCFLGSSLRVLLSPPSLIPPTAKDLVWLSL